jgi:hypothetical protein
MTVITTMTRTRARRIPKRALLAGALVAAALGGGCAEDPCDQLLDVCIRCTDPTVRRSCSSTVQTDMSETCEYLIDFYGPMCP